MQLPVSLSDDALFEWAFLKDELELLNNGETRCWIILGFIVALLLFSCVLVLRYFLAASPKKETNVAEESSNRPKKSTKSLVIGGLGLVICSILVFLFLQAISEIQQKKQFAELKFQATQFAINYVSFAAAENRRAASLKDVIDFSKKTGTESKISRIVKLIKEETLIVNWQQPSSFAYIIAYEVKPEPSSSLMVIWGNGKVEFHDKDSLDKLDKTGFNERSLLELLKP